MSAEAVALHDAVSALRSGAVDGHAFTHVMLVGHSFGAVEAWLEAAGYHDVDAVLVTGALHAISPDISALEAALYPAVLDPKFASSGLDDGYLTTEPGTRGSLFYDPATTNLNPAAAHLKVVVIPATGHALALAATAPAADAVMIGWSLSVLAPDTLPS